MAEPTIQLGGGNWAGKTDNLLGYYKEGERFYKQDFTFSRSTTGTYTDSDGYIQEMPYNKLLQSNTFDTSWSNSGTTETSGQSGYDGTNNAWLLEKSQSNAYIYQNITQSNTQTISVYAKSGSIGGIEILIDDSVNSSQNYNLDNGTLIGSGNGESSSIEDVGGGWYRCIFTINDSATRIRFYPTTNTGDKSGTSGSIYIQNAQLVKGSSAKTYFPTTTRLNMPRVDYLNNSNGSLILEPQRTNLVTHSSDFSTYLSANITTTTNNSTSPDGTINANKATPSTANGQHRYTPSYSVTSSTKYAASVFAKKDGYNKIRITENATTGGYADFDLLNGQVLSTSNVDSAIIEDYGDGWYRCIIVETTGSTSFRFDIIVLDDDNNVSFVGDGTSSVLLWGAQLEQGSYATTLINTSGSSVTRNADACSLTNVADRINSSEGVLFAEVVFSDDSQYKFISLNSGSSANRVSLYSNSPTFISVNVRNSSGNQFNANFSIDSTINHKIALKYKENDFALWIDGQERLTDSSGTTFTTSTLSELSFDDGSGGSDFYGKIKDLKVYNTALSDSELATLTT